MENDEREDLLIELTESDEEVCIKEEIDYYIEEKILDFIQNENKNSNSNKTITFLTSCLFIFLASTVLVIVIPIYIKYSSFNEIPTYSKLVTLSYTNAILFFIVHIVGVLSKCECQESSIHSLCISDVLKVGGLMSSATISIFWLLDGNYVRCHLEDPLKGCSVVFSFLFYYVFSRKRMSLERTFCAITIIVGVFVSVDFGMCDKFRCNGNSKIIEVTPRLHFFNVILYLLSHGVWVLNFTVLEVCWTSFKSSTSAASNSVLSNLLGNGNSRNENSKSLLQNLSVIYKDEGDQESIKPDDSKKQMTDKKASANSKNNSALLENDKASEKSVINSLPCTNQFSVFDFKKFPVTSTPKNEMDRWQSWSSGRCQDVALWQHFICCLVITALCWLPTLSFLNDGNEKLLADVVTDALDSFRCHLGLSTGSACSLLPAITSILSVSYVILILSSIKLLRLAQSAITVIAVMMPALPVSGLFWSLFHMNESPYAFLEFNPEITGEAVCAVLGLPIIGIGLVLLIKSHIREFNLVM